MTSADTGVDASDAGVTDAETGADTGILPDAGACNTLVNGAPTIQETATSSAVPTRTGGVIADGTYFMTANIDYQTTSADKTHTYTVKVSGKVMDLVGHDNANSEIHAEFAITNNSDTGAISLIGTCPAALVGQDLGSITSYTVIGAAWHLYSTAKNNEAVFTKQ